MLPTGDGAAAIVLASNKVAKQFRRDAHRGARLAPDQRPFMTGFRDMTSPEITVRGAKETFEEAGIGPENIHVAEVHDASRSRNFSITRRSGSARADKVLRCWIRVLRAWAAGFR